MNIPDACESMNAKIKLKNKYSMVNISCSGDDSCENGRFIIQTESDDYITTDNSVSGIHFDCNGIQSCKNGIVAVIGMDAFELNCDGTEACIHLDVTSKASNGANGIFTLNCNGTSSCDRVSIDGVSMNSVNVNCENGHLACFDVQVN